VACVPRDPAHHHRQAVEFHLRYAAAWADERTGRDLAEQVDPDFAVSY
jgi:CO dehydrogenase maturation factor